MQQQQQQHPQHETDGLLLWELVRQQQHETHQRLAQQQREIDRLRLELEAYSKATTGTIDGPDALKRRCTRSTCMLEYRALDDYRLVVCRLCKAPVCHKHSSRLPWSKNMDKKHCTNCKPLVDQMHLARMQVKEEELSPSGDDEGERRVLPTIHG